MYAIRSYYVMGITLNKEINTKELTRNETPGNISKEGNFKTDYLVAGTVVAEPVTEGDVHIQ